MHLKTKPNEFLSDVAASDRSLRAMRADLSSNFKRWEIEATLRTHFQRHILTDTPSHGDPYCCGVRSGEIEIEFASCIILECDGAKTIDTDVQISNVEENSNSSGIEPGLNFGTEVNSASS